MAGKTREKSGGRKAWFSPPPAWPRVAWGQLAPSLTRAPARNLTRVPGQQPVPPGVPSEPSAQRLWPSEAEGESPSGPRRPSAGGRPSGWRSMRRGSPRDACGLPSGPVLPPATVPQVLKILLHLCGHGSSSSLLILKRNPAFIQEAAGIRALGRGGQGRLHRVPLLTTAISQRRPSHRRDSPPGPLPSSPRHPAPQPPPSLCHGLSLPSVAGPAAARWLTSACVPCLAWAAQARPACSSARHTRGALSSPPDCSPGPRQGGLWEAPGRGGVPACRGLGLAQLGLGWGSISHSPAGPGAVPCLFP